MPEGKRLKVTLLKSMNGRLATHKACVRGLGLRRVRQSRVIEDTQQNRGMINKVAYFLQIEEV
ncbi:MAG TPA: 50S ribosomal protein L30 [Gammaproteobacteria bacterium]|nr:50S ribosomal protein L30 [Gammaproteobacteria bacterium]